MPADPEPPDLPAPPVPGPAEAVVADQAAAAAVAAGTGNRGPFRSHCENCGAKLEGPFCHRCGQHDFEFHRSFRHVFLDVVGTLFNFEGKFFRDIATLLFQPGRLTAEFNRGKRASHMPPFRLYVFVSFVFFLFAFIDRDDEKAFQLGTDRVAALNSPEKAKGAAATAPDAPKEPGASPAKPNAAAPEFEQRLEKQARRLLETGNRQALADSFRAHVPQLLMLCLPFFAFYARVLFRKSGLVFLEQLVVALHFHTFIYLWLLFCDGWGWLAGFVSPLLGGLFALAGKVWLTVYPLLMVRRLFGESWSWAIFKTLVLALAYAITLGIGFAVTLILVFASV